MQEPHRLGGFFRVSVAIGAVRCQALNVGLDVGGHDLVQGEAFGFAVCEVAIDGAFVAIERVFVVDAGQEILEVEETGGVAVFGDHNRDVGADLLMPLHALMTQRVLQSKVIHTDDTPVKVQDRSLDRTRTGWFWGYLGNGRHPYTVFDYTPSRSRDGPMAFLRDWGSEQRVNFKPTHSVVTTGFTRARPAAG